MEQSDQDKCSDQEERSDQKEPSNQEKQYTEHLFSENKQFFNKEQANIEEHLNFNLSSESLFSSSDDGKYDHAYSCAIMQ